MIRSKIKNKLENQKIVKSYHAVPQLVTLEANSAGHWHLLNHKPGVAFQTLHRQIDSDNATVRRLRPTARRGRVPVVGGFRRR